MKPAETRRRDPLTDVPRIILIALMSLLGLLFIGWAIAARADANVAFVLVGMALFCWSAAIYIVWHHQRSIKTLRGRQRGTHHNHRRIS